MAAKKPIVEDPEAWKVPPSFANLANPAPNDDDAASVSKTSELPEVDFSDPKFAQQPEAATNEPSELHTPQEGESLLTASTLVSEPPPERTKFQLALETFAQKMAEQPPPVAPPPALQPVVVAAPPPQLSLEDAANAVLVLLDDRYVAVIREQASRTGGSIANVIAGVLSLLGDQGNLGDMAINPRWMDMIRNQQSVQTFGNIHAAPPKRAVCEYCGHEYKPIRFSQRFCCTTCGKTASGYAAEPIPHSEDCTTAPGITFRKALEMNKKKELAQAA